MCVRFSCVSGLWRCRGETVERSRSLRAGDSGDVGGETVERSRSTGAGPLAMSGVETVGHSNSNVLWITMTGRNGANRTCLQRANAARL